MNLGNGDKHDVLASVAVVAVVRADPMVLQSDRRGVGHMGMNPAGNGQVVALGNRGNMIGNVGVTVAPVNIEDPRPTHVVNFFPIVQVNGVVDYQTVITGQAGRAGIDRVGTALRL